MTASELNVRNVKEVAQNTPMVRTYVRNKQGNPVGVVLAVKNEDGTVRVGWSKCNRVDTFSKDHGVFVALQRALHPRNHPEGSNVVVPNKVKTKLAQMKNRAAKYFKVPVEQVQ